MKSILQLCASSLLSETSLLLSMRIAALACQGLAMLFLGAILPAGDFGRYGLFVGSISLLALVLESGVFGAVARVGAFRERAGLQQQVGFATVIALPVYVVAMVAMLAIAVFANSFGKEYFSTQLLPALLFAPALLVHNGLCQICVAASRIRVLSLLRVVAPSLSLAGVLSLYAMGRLDYGRAALCYTAGFLAASVLATGLLRPRFDKMKSAWDDTRQYLAYGRDMYISRVVAMGVYKLDVPLVALFLDFESVGYYALARGLLAPFALLTQSISATRYKQYAQTNQIPQSDRLLAYSASLASGLIPAALAATALPILFPDKPASFFHIVYILAARVVVQSISSLYNMYFTATGRSTVVRRVSVLTSILNLLLYLALIPWLGVIGVAVADLLDCGAYLALLLKAYHRPEVPRGEVTAQETVASSADDETVPANPARRNAA